MAAEAREDDGCRLDNDRYADAAGPWTALLMAGRRPGGDAMAEAAGVAYKALIPIGGHTMLRHVAQALLDVPQIGRIVIMAQEPDALLTADTRALADNPRIRFLASAGGISDSIAAIAGGDAAPWPVFVTTADNPLLTPHSVMSFLEQALASDISVGVVDRQTILSAYPGTRRTWLSFRDGAYSGANMFALTSDKAQAAVRFWSALEQDRKKGWKIISSFGPYLLLRALTRTISFEDALAKAGARFGLAARPVNLRVAEAAIDVDKPHDLELVTQIMADRAKR